jgi:hypothetical protein
MINLIDNEYVRAFNTLGDSGIEWIDTAFKLCVMLLVDLSKILGVTYEELNIWIFVIIWPLLTIFETLLIVILFIKLRKANIRNRPRY